MVCHETNQDAGGRWLFPDDVEKAADGSAVHAETGAPVTVGRVLKMSKSKRNVVDQEAIIATYGADTARWFMRSDSPPERDLEWKRGGVAGAWSYSQRVGALVGDTGGPP